MTFQTRIRAGLVIKLNHAGLNSWVRSISGQLLPCSGKPSIPSTPTVKPSLRHIAVQFPLLMSKRICLLATICCHSSPASRHCGSTCTRLLYRLDVHKGLRPHVTLTAVIVTVRNLVIQDHWLGWWRICSPEVPLKSQLTLSWKHL